MISWDKDFRINDKGLVTDSLTNHGLLVLELQLKISCHNFQYRTKNSGLKHDVSFLLVSLRLYHGWTEHCEHYCYRKTKLLCYCY